MPSRPLQQPRWSPTTALGFGALWVLSIALVSSTRLGTPWGREKAFPWILLSLLGPLSLQNCRPQGQGSAGPEPQELRSARASFCRPQQPRSLWGVGREMGNCSRSRFSSCSLPSPRSDLSQGELLGGKNPLTCAFYLVFLWLLFKMQRL